MNKPWDELTSEEEIDALEGWELSEAVGHALPWLTVERLSGPNVPWWSWRLGGIVMARSEWQPAENATQALQVWDALPSDDKGVEFTSSDDAEAWCYVGPTRIRSYGSFWIAICRTYLKARLEEERVKDGKDM